MLYPIEKIKIVEPFCNLFPISEKILSAIVNNMKEKGYDLSKPVSIWKHQNILVDGHTRVKAAISCGFSEIPIFEHDFKDEDEAFYYAVSQQRDRRNLTDADILRLVEICDKRRGRGGDRKTEKSIATRVAIEKSRSSAETAEKIGTNRGKVEKARQIIEQGDDAIKKAILKGEKTINAATKEIREKEKISDNLKTFNQTNEQIEWAKWSWNPVTGCLHGCQYCYARDIAMRFIGDFNPKFYPERLSAPANTKLPKTNDPGWNHVFVCSMADLFGDWVKKEWIEAVLAEVKKNPQWVFIFLTKNPRRLLEFEFPQNSWVGATIDRQARVEPTEKIFTKLRAPIKFVSLEPLLEPILFNSPVIFDWFIVGARSKNTSGAEFQPKWEWVESILRQAREANCKIYFKPNLKIWPKEFPHSSR